MADFFFDFHTSIPWGVCLALKPHGPSKFPVNSLEIYHPDLKRKPDPSSSQYYVEPGAFVVKLRVGINSQRHLLGLLEFKPPTFQKDPFKWLGAGVLKGREELETL